MTLQVYFRGVTMAKILSATDIGKRLNQSYSKPYMELKSDFLILVLIENITVSYDTVNVSIYFEGHREYFGPVWYVSNNGNDFDGYGTLRLHFAILDMHK